MFRIEHAALQSAFMASAGDRLRSHRSVAATPDRRLQAEGRCIDVFVQVNSCGEASKYVLSPDEVATFVRKLSAFSALLVCGLTTLAALSGDAARALPDSYYWPATTAN